MIRFFNEDTIFISAAETVEGVFKEVADQLVAKDLVTTDFYDNLMLREQAYPTALPLKPINPELLNIAIPHTESQYVKVTRIVPVKLANPIIFHNMIVPDEEVEVSFLFMILNQDGGEQAGILSSIMDFINRQDVNDLKEFFNYTDPKQIYNYLSKHF